jgi:spore coat polysaccharide biosynthesis protein SpsF (cytidylyltransferase family)
MMAACGLVSVRVASSRLPRKCLMEFGEGTVVHHILRRAKHFGLTPLVCTTIDAADDIIEVIARDEGCNCFRGSDLDKLRRWRDACRHYDITDFHTVDADDPFFDGELSHQSLALLRERQLDAVQPPATTYVGGAGYSLTRDVVERACAAAVTADTEMAWYHIERVGDLRATQLEAPVRLDDIRLTLDYQEDYWLLRTVLRVVGPLADRAEIAALFRRNPELRSVNWFRNAAWQMRQEAQRL